MTDYGWTNNGNAWIAYRVTPGIIRSGIVGIPAGMREALGEGRWPLLTADGKQIGDLVCRRAKAWGLGPYFRRRRPSVGDVMVLEIDRKTGTATIFVGGPEFLEQSERQKGQAL